MDDNRHEIILDHLRAIRSDMAGISGKLTDHDKRFSLIVRQLVAIRGDIAITHELIVDHGDGIRDLKARVERLERHAGLSEAMKQ